MADLTDEQKATLAAKEAEEKIRAETCASEVQGIFKKYNCHPVLKLTFASNGANEYRFDVETDAEPSKA